MVGDNFRACSPLTRVLKPRDPRASRVVDCCPAPSVWGPHPPEEGPSLSRPPLRPPLWPRGHSSASVSRSSPAVASSGVFGAGFCPSARRFPVPTLQQQNQRSSQDRFGLEHVPSCMCPSSAAGKPRCPVSTHRPPLGSMKEQGTAPRSNPMDELPASQVPRAHSGCCGTGWSGQPLQSRELCC